MRCLEIRKSKLYLIVWIAEFDLRIEPRFSKGFFILHSIADRSWNYLLWPSATTAARIA
jgi:hypothetical protein